MVRLPGHASVDNHALISRRWNLAAGSFSALFTMSETMLCYMHKWHLSFVDMLSVLRKVLWQHRMSPNLRFSQRVKELIETVSYGLFAV